MALPQILTHIENVWIDPAVENEPLAERIKRQFPPEKIRRGIPRLSPSTPFPETVHSLKRQLFVTRYQGHLVKPCPGSRGRICCGYWIINAMVHCPMDCHYCILQTYLSVPAMTIYTNEGEIREEIRQRLLTQPDHIFRFGTGELGDSLIHDALTDFSRRMVPFFAETRNGILELKSKTAAIGTLKDLDPKGHTVISWSLNPPFIIHRIEPKTASLTQRIEAARLCQEAGYWIGFHFDPVIWYEGWERDYYAVPEAIAHALDPERILWISIAGLRYTRSQKERIRQRFPDSPLFLGEFFRDEDGKFRYLQILRTDMYRKILSWLREWSPDLFIYYCMENQRVWDMTFPSPPKNTRELDAKFNETIWKHLGKRE